MHIQCKSETTTKTSLCGDDLWIKVYFESCVDVDVHCVSVENVKALRDFNRLPMYIHQKCMYGIEQPLRTLTNKNP